MFSLTDLQSYQVLLFLMILVTLIMQPHWNMQPSLKNKALKYVLYTCHPSEVSPRYFQITKTICLIAHRAMLSIWHQTFQKKIVLWPKISSNTTCPKVQNGFQHTARQRWLTSLSDYVLIQSRISLMPL